LTHWWNERTGVYDDLCYLRQAHLFQRFGWDGLNTDITRDDDHFFSSSEKEIGYPFWNDPTRAICHILKERTGKRVIQYPPGTGFFLSVFPEGFQRVPVYIAANIFLFVISLLAIGFAETRRSIIAAGTFGCLALYFMINPAKASYSMAPTMMVCAIGGLLTPPLFYAATRRRRFATAAALGFLLGLSVSFRLANLFLAIGYFLVFAIALIEQRKIEFVLLGATFGILYMVGLSPTLLANFINAGGPFSTTYGSGDAAVFGLSFDVVSAYAKSTQGLLIGVAIVSTIVMLRFRISRYAAYVVALNLITNLAFFLTHPISTSYYLMPLAMLSLWTLLFSWLMHAREYRSSPV
jgi:hypothetical protein